MRGFIRQRKDGRWEGRVELPQDKSTGKRKKKYVYANSKTECQLLVNELIYEVQSGKFTDAGKLTVDGYLLSWYEKIHSGKIEATTREGYENILHNHLIPHFKGTKIKDLLPLHIEEYYNVKRQLGLSDNTIKKHHAFLSKAFNDALKNRIITLNPCVLVDKPRPKEFTPTVPSFDEYFELLERARGTEFEAAILLMGMCGHRRGEACGALVSDFDTQKQQCSIRRNVSEVSRKAIEKHKTNGTVIETSPDSKKVLLIKPYPKSGKSRITDAPMAVLEYIENIDPKKYVIGQSDRPVSPTNFFKRFESFLKKNDLGHFNFHAFRHFYGTALMEAGIAPRAAQEMLGHSTIQMTMKYQHPKKDSAKIYKLENYLAGGQFGGQSKNQTSQT